MSKKLIKNNSSDSRSSKKLTGSIVVCGANSYNQKYYLNPKFSSLPSQIKDELKIMCVSYTEEIGGILTLEFEPNGSLLLKTVAYPDDFAYDEIGSKLRINQLKADRQEFFSSMEMYCKVFILGTS